MASHATAIRPATPSVPARAPHTFQEALKQGWAVIRDKSVQSINQKRREGRLTLQKRGIAALLEVDYIGTRKGYQFSVPKFVAD